MALETREPLGGFVLCCLSSLSLSLLFFFSPPNDIMPGKLNQKKKTFHFLAAQFDALRRVAFPITKQSDQLSLVFDVVCLGLSSREPKTTAIYKTKPKTMSCMRIYIPEFVGHSSRQSIFEAKCVSINSTETVCCCC